MPADRRLGLAVQDAIDRARMKTEPFQTLSGRLDLPLAEEAPFGGATFVDAWPLPPDL
jgi:hypothetical protein